MRSRSWERMPTPRSSTVSRSELASWIRPTRMGAGRAALASAALRIRFTSRSYRAVDAAEALRLRASEDPDLKQRKEQGLPVIDAVFADLQMPGLSGMEM